MGSQTLEILRQGVWASLTGGWFYDPHQDIFCNTFHLYVWLFLLCLPFTIYLYFPPTAFAWGAYCATVAALFATLKLTNLGLHRMFDTSERIQEPGPPISEDPLAGRRLGPLHPHKRRREEENGIELQVLGAGSARLPSSGDSPPAGRSSSRNSSCNGGGMGGTTTCTTTTSTSAAGAGALPLPLPSSRTVHSHGCGTTMTTAALSMDGDSVASSADFATASSSATATGGAGAGAAAAAATASMTATAGAAAAASASVQDPPLYEPSTCIDLRVDVHRKNSSESGEECMGLRPVVERVAVHRAEPFTQADHERFLRAGRHPPTEKGGRTDEPRATSSARRRMKLAHQTSSTDSQEDRSGTAAGNLGSDQRPSIASAESGPGSLVSVRPSGSGRRFSSVSSAGFPGGSVLKATGSLELGYMLEAGDGLTTGAGSLRDKGLVYWKQRQSQAEGGSASGSRLPGYRYLRSGRMLCGPGLPPLDPASSHPAGLQVQTDSASSSLSLTLGSPRSDESNAGDSFEERAAAAFVFSANRRQRLSSRRAFLETPLSGESLLSQQVSYS